MCTPAAAERGDHAAHVPTIQAIACHGSRALATQLHVLVGLIVTLFSGSCFLNRLEKFRCFPIRANTPEHDIPH
jgi:hypothetical protein